MKRSWTTSLAAIVAVVALAACTVDKTGRVATAGGSPSTSPSAGPAGQQSQELQFVACMRGEGIADMPDPVAGDTSGHSSVRYAIDVMGKGSDEAFQAALDTCLSLLPAGEPPKPATSDEIQALLQYSACMRDNGVPDFPDPNPDLQKPTFGYVDAGPDRPAPRVQHAGELFLFNIRDPVIEAANEKCSKVLPQN